MAARDRLKAGPHLAEDMIERERKQHVLVLDVPVEGGDAGVELRGQTAKGQGLKATGVEDCDRRFDDLVAPEGGADAVIGHRLDAARVRALEGSLGHESMSDRLDTRTLFEHYTEP
jgi:hypothetical protein